MKVDSEIKTQKPFESMHRVEAQYSVTEDEGISGRTYLSYNLSVGDTLDKKLYIAMQILDYALFSAPGAQVRQALIDAGIGNANGDPESLLRHAGEALAYLTQCAAVMTTPSGENTKIKRVELVPISPHTAMIVLLASNGILRSKLFRLDSAIDTTICETFYNVAQAMLIGVPVSSLTPAYLQSIAARLGMESLAMFPMLSAVAELSQSAAQPHVFLSGQSNLLHHREYAGRAYELLEFLSRGTPLRTLADSMKGELEIRIGRENGFVQLDNSSVILARYTVGEDSSGSIGIIGPTRMDYRRLVPGLKYISQCISKTMEKALEE